MSGFRVTGTGGDAEVSVNHSLQVNVAEQVNALTTANAYGETYEVGNNGRVRQSPENHILNDQFSGNAINNGLWITGATNIANGVANGFILFNSANWMTSGAYLQIQSLNCPAFWGDYSAYVHFRARIQPAAGAIIEMGQMRAPFSTAAPTDGFFFRVNGDGTVSVVMSFAGSETISTSTNVINPATNYEFQLEILTGAIKWYIADAAGNTFFTDGGSSTAANPLQSLNLKPVQIADDPHLPIVARIRITSSTSVAPTMALGEVNFIQRDVARNKPWGDAMACQGRGAYQGPTAALFAQTANHANSTNPTSASLSNTVAGYTTLGGRFQFAAPAGATTDYCLFGFQVPLAWQLVITGVSISTMNTGATVATTPTLLDWSIAVGSSSVSLAVGGSELPKRIPLGVQAFKVGDLAGTVAGDINRTFQTPIVGTSIGDTIPGFVQIIVQVPTGTATASQVIRGDVMINGYFE